MKKLAELRRLKVDFAKAALHFDKLPGATPLTPEPPK
jgi:hypothetical protein